MGMPSEGDVLDAFRSVLANAPGFLFGRARIHAEHGLNDGETGKPMRGTALRTQAAYVLGNLEGWNDKAGSAARATLRAFLRESQELPVAESAFEVGRDFYRQVATGFAEARLRAGKPLTEAAAKKPNRPTCVFCKRSEGVQFAVFNPRFKPFGTACVDCERTLPPGTQVPDSAAPAPTPK